MEWRTGSVWTGVRSAEGPDTGAPKADAVVHGGVHVDGRPALNEKFDGGIPDCPIGLGSNFGKAGALIAAANGVPNDGKPGAHDDESTEVPLDAPPMPEKTGFGPCEVDENGSSTQVDVECSISSGEFAWNAFGTTCKLTDEGFWTEVGTGGAQGIGNEPDAVDERGTGSGSVCAGVKSGEGPKAEAPRAPKAELAPAQGAKAELAPAQGEAPHVLGRPVPKDKFVEGVPDWPNIPVGLLGAANCLPHDGKLGANKFPG